MKQCTACVECRAGKRKCTASAPNSRCHQCVKRQLDCSLRIQGSPGRLRQPSLLPATQQEMLHALQPSHEIKDELVTLYLRHLHNQPHTLFHEPSLLEEVRSGTVSHNVLFGILGLSARYACNFCSDVDDTDIFTSGSLLLLEPVLAARHMPLKPNAA
jgi:hypothetical protein